MGDVTGLDQDDLSGGGETSDSECTLKKTCIGFNNGLDVGKWEETKAILRVCLCNYKKGLSSYWDEEDGSWDLGWMKEDSVRPYGMCLEIIIHLGQEIMGQRVKEDWSL